ncbi:hypothetical protein Q5707_42745 (plasmid) [Rhodococcus opacus]|uniref:Secreted protein n=1 Tax=Rhodococcus opacus TaxID=37919 RepID=A0AAX3YUQ2_RHOOP|nr:hypothetical protein [Rhodococcus opacus]WLF52141.1 hypothetical protein Q5707_42745 [Rhodococcus opacus]
MSAVADAVFAAVFVVASAVAVWPARCTVAVKRGACVGPPVQKFHSGGVAERMGGFGGMDLDWCSEGAAVFQPDAGPG